VWSRKYFAVCHFDALITGYELSARRAATANSRKANCHVAPASSQGIGVSILAILLSHSFSARCSIRASSSLLVHRRQRSTIGAHPIRLGVIDRGEGVAIGLLLAQVSANRLGVTIAWESSVSTGGFGDAVHPVPAVTLRQQPPAERNLLPIIVILLDHVHAFIVAAACH